MSFTAPDYRYDPFNQTFTAFGHGYSGNPKEEYTIPSSAPYYVLLNEIPRDDSPSTLLVNEQGGSSFTEVSFSTSPASGQFRAVYGSDGTEPISNIGQGTLEFNAADAGKTIEVAYYALGAIVQNQFFNKLNDSFYGTPTFASGLTGDVTGDLTGDVTADTIAVDTMTEKTASNGIDIEGLNITDTSLSLANTINANALINVPGSSTTNLDYTLPTGAQLLYLWNVYGTSGTGNAGSSAIVFIPSTGALLSDEFAAYNSGGNLSVVLSVVSGTTVRAAFTNSSVGSVNVTVTRKFLKVGG